VKLYRKIFAAAAVLALAACADVPTDPAELADYNETNDPAEPTNRAIFSANYFLDRNLLQPAARAYSDHVPDEARKSIHNFVSNLGEPAVLVNDLLQGNTDKAWTTTQRFVVNTTIGGGGLFDPAADWGLNYHTADFGQTFGVWGIGTGPSVQLPLFGFSNLRDGVGLAFGAFANPLGYIPGAAASDIMIASGGLGLIDGRAEALFATDDLEKTSLDYYAALRGIAAHRRAELVAQGLSD
jgi:phospholipid-binding lipoprotein MlaA